MVETLCRWLLSFEELLIRSPKDDRDLSSTERIYLFVF